jgi:hypothetical protein
LQRQTNLFDIPIGIFLEEILLLEWVHLPPYWPLSVAKEQSAITELL